jgi:DNA-binding response OmpR family regulator
MRKILCVDDDVYLTDLLQYALGREGYSVQVANRGAKAIQLAETDPPDAVILDVNLPDANGFTLCTQFRTALHVPVIMLTARHADEDVVHGFGLGADDYISKPFNMQVLVHRLNAVLRRTYPLNANGVSLNRTYRLGPARFSPEHNEIAGAGSSTKLTPTESKILSLLASNEGKVLPAERIMEQIWGYDSESDLSVIKTHIRRLRAKIAEVVGELQVIHTVPGRGYTFRQEAPVVIPFDAARREEVSS